MEEKIINTSKKNRDYTAVYKALGGRPDERDRVKIAVDLIEWADKETSINLNQFCADQGIPANYLNRWAKEDDGFRAAYLTAKAKMEPRRDAAVRLNRISTRGYDANMKVYDLLLYDQWKEEKDWEKRLDQEIENAKSENDKGRLAEQLQAIKESLLRKSNDCT